VLQDAQVFLDDLLAHGPVSRDTILRQARGAGLTLRTLERAKAALTIQSECKREDGRNVWYWSLPPDTETPRVLEQLWRQEAELRGEAEA
jgi:hypothetical protein